MVVESVFRAPLESLMFDISRMSDRERETEDSYLLRLERTLRSSRRSFQRAMREAGSDLSGEQWVALKLVNDIPRIKQKGLAERTEKDPAAVNRVIDVLVRKGYLVRAIDPSDGRAVALHITTFGEHEVARLSTVADHVRASGIAAIAPKELAHALDVLHRMERNFGTRSA